MRVRGGVNNESRDQKGTGLKLALKKEGRLHQLRNAGGSQKQEKAREQNFPHSSRKNSTPLAP